ncbi:hypothetical protein ACFO8O_02130 [Hephaestia sp. GCM10023244]|uniref:hypothetical protein n=1 Tax=unclassified Hephaestia TaxID=2631281 RepID=UPI0020776F21|nr:hypothetical protein [Hephaestia sp. MAHUQ-44]MCM8729770.1 hypothetical protein [Hephaestia sp. MAHUQ-44]
MTFAAATAPPVGAQTVPAATTGGEAAPELSVGTEVTYSPNPFLLPGDDRGAIAAEARIDARYTLLPSVQSKLAFAGSLRDRGYSRRYGNVVFGEARLDASYRANEYLSLLGTGQFRRAPLIDRLTTSVDAGVDPRAVSNAIYGRLAVQWTPDAHTMILPEVEAERTSYDRSGLLETTRVLRTALAVSHRTGPTTTIGVRGGGRFSRGGPLDATTWFVNATLETRVARDWTLTAELGVERNRFDAGAPGAPARGSGPVLLNGRGALCRNGERREICFRAGLFSEASGIGGLQRRTFANASWREAIGQRMSLRLLGEYQHAGAGEGDLAAATDAYRAAVTLERTLVPTLTLGGTLEYIRRGLPLGRAVDSFFVGAALRFTPRLQ